LVALKPVGWRVRGAHHGCAAAGEEAGPRGALELRHQRLHHPPELLLVLRHRRLRHGHSVGCPLLCCSNWHDSPLDKTGDQPSPLQACGVMSSISGDLRVPRQLAGPAAAVGIPTRARMASVATLGLGAASAASSGGSSSGVCASTRRRAHPSSPAAHASAASRVASACKAHRVAR
jgi:hypothetical protein